MRVKTVVVAASCLSLALAAGARAADWPTYNRDAARSAVTDESLRLPLKTAWTHASPHPPAAAWPDPARHDYWHNKHHLNPRVIYDRAFHVAIAGDAVFFGSSADDRVVCLGLADGKVRWTFITEGPVRLAPTVADGKVYVGSDDGWVYCLSASDGRLLWKARPGPDDRRCIGNGRMISRWPVRTGVIVDDGFAYCAAGLLPTTEGVYLCALDAASGRQHWKQKVNQPAQGYLLASSDRLYLPSGRTGPGAFDRKDGRSQGGVASAGGGYALVAGDVVAAGPGDTAGQLDLSDAKTRHRIVSFGGLHLIARESRYYVHLRTHLAALDRAKYMPLARRRVALQTQLKELGKRKDAEAERARLTKVIDGCTAAMKTCWLWRAPCAEPYALILASNTLFAGGEGRVVAYRADDGQQVWSGNVNGRAYGLAASGGRLLVSTNQGAITCFEHGVGATGTSAEPEATPAARPSKKAAHFPVTLFAELPQARVSDDGTAVIEWESTLDAPAVVEYGTSRDKLTGKAEATAQAGRFRATIQGLAPNRICWYRAVFDDAQAGHRHTSDAFSFRTPTDPFALPSPYPKDKWTPLYERAAAAALRQCGASQGFCLVLDAGTGRLAYEIAKRSDLRIVGIEGDAAKVAAARRALSRVGAYGKRIAIHHAAGHGDRLPYPPYFANLIVSDAAVVGGTLPPSQEEILRVLRPYGGVVCIGRPEGDAPVRPWLAVSRWQGAEARVVEENGLWAVVRRGRLAGAGEWTHGLADLGNTACSQDERITGPLQVQWFGRPGPREMADRHHRNVSPLVKSGRLFVPGDEQVIAVDAYNGTELWTRRIPNSRRLGVFLDSSNMAVDDTALYFVAQDTCHQFAVATGKTRREIVMPQLVRGETRHWGYLAPADGLLVGSGRRPHAAYFRQSREADAALWNDKMALVTSDYLFALGPAGGRPRWTYKSGLILNTTLAIGGGRVYFVESHSPKALADKVGRMPMVTFLDGPNHLVALDLKTGRTLWKQEADLANCRHIAYINYAAEKLVLSGNKYIDGRLWYFFWGIEADSGTIAWHRSHNSGYKPGGAHGEQNRHPTV
ncbi:MAG: PQQ-binding-like beta-propeller repeat protein, partial [Planctomycetota bacterium]|nr:PQQ-binding-like beta-propeller repeat protein [Planctomycetota bacterium]